MKITNRITKAEAAPMLTTDDVAAKLGIKRSAVYPLCYRRDGLRAYKVGGLLRFKPEDVEEFMNRPLQEEQPEQTQQSKHTGDLSNLIVGVKFV